MKSSKTITNGGTSFLGEVSFGKEGSVDRAGFEPAELSLSFGKERSSRKLCFPLCFLFIQNT
jgi:hypothetical protein